MLKEIADRYFVTRNLLQLLMSSPTLPKKEIGVTSRSYYEAYAGKRIASIRFKRLDPFGPTLQDTARTAYSWLGRTGNNLHMNTTRGRLRMNLLFKEGDLLDPFVMAENEKIMRDLPYLEDVAFILKPSLEYPGEIDIIVITKDRFEYGANVSISSNDSKAEIINENMFGIGHQMRAGIITSTEDQPSVGPRLTYNINNFDGRFTNALIGYENSFREKQWAVNIERNFITSTTRMAGGINFENNYRTHYININHPIKLDSAISYQLLDLWVGFTLNQAQRNQGRRSAIFARYLFQDFEMNPYPINDGFMRDRHFFLAGFTLSKRNLFRNNQIYSHGIVEDIPFGHLFEAKIGIDQSQLGNWPYAGLSFTKASILRNKGYFNWKIAFDGFLQDEKIRQGTFLFKMNYFSDLFKIGSGTFRQFINMELLSGYNRFEQEYITINRRNGIRDFRSEAVEGTNRLKFSFEMVRFMKMNFYGFRFSNYYYADFAFLSDRFSDLLTSDFYSGFGIGFRIHNESLIFNLLDIRLTWFPVAPPGNTNFFLNASGQQKNKFDNLFGNKPDQIPFR